MLRWFSNEHGRPFGVCPARRASVPRGVRSRVLQQAAERDVRFRELRGGDLSLGFIGTGGARTVVPIYRQGITVRYERHTVFFGKMRTGISRTGTKYTV